MNFKFPWTKRKEERLKREAKIRWGLIVYELYMMRYDALAVHESMIPNKVNSKVVATGSWAEY